MRDTRLSWHIAWRYKSFVRGIDKSLTAEFATDESKNLDVPALVVTAAYDHGSRPEFQIPAAEKYLSNRRIEKFDCSHWIPLEKPKELVKLLQDFVSSLWNKFVMFVD